MELDSTFAPLIDFVRTHKQWAAPIVLVLAFGESMAFISLILPFWGILVAIGSLIGVSNTVEFWSIMVAAAVGAALGDWLSFWLGRHYHEQIAKMWPLNKHPDLLPRGHAFFDKWGPWAVVLGRFSGPLRASIPIVAGAVRMHPPTFQLANWSSAFLWAFSLLVIGEGLGQTLTAIRKLMGLG